MSHFYGTIDGKAKNTSTQCGSKNSGLVTNAAGWQGAIQVHLTEVDGVDQFTVSLVPWQGSGGESIQLAHGILDASNPAVTFMTKGDAPNIAR